MSNRPNPRTGSSAAARARASSGTSGGGSRGVWVIVAVVAVVLVAGLVAVLLARGEDSSAGGTSDVSLVDPRAAEPVKVEGRYLPVLPESGTDPAVGMAMPSMTGTGIDGQTVEVGGDTGKPQMIVYMAHWCPHCNRELPQLVDWWSEGLPEGVEITAVTTSIDPAKPNYPPTEWLADAGWQVPTLLDPTGAAAEASGLSGFPFFVFVDADGNVVERRSGEQPIDSLQAAVTGLQQDAPAAS